MTPPDILAAIDAATNELCACGCGTPLDPNGPSGWFADPDCQRRWSGRQATNPGDVYRRPDAAVVPVGADSTPIALSGGTVEFWWHAPGMGSFIGTALETPDENGNVRIRLHSNPLAPIEDDADEDEPDDGGEPVDVSEWADLGWIDEDGLSGLGVLAASQPAPLYTQGTYSADVVRRMIQRLNDH